MTKSNASSLLERLKWTLLTNGAADTADIAQAIVREIETTHCIIDPEEVTEAMLEACFGALPEHYDPPDPKRLPWHAYKAKRRFTAMAKAVPIISR